MANASSRIAAYLFASGVDVPADGDYYEALVFQDSGGNLDVQGGAWVSYFQANFLP